MNDWTDDGLATLKRMHTSGEASSAIATATGRTRSAVCGKLFRLYSRKRVRRVQPEERLPRAPDHGFVSYQDLTPAQAAKLRRMWVDGGSRTEIARAIGISHEHAEQEIGILRDEARPPIYRASRDQRFVKRLLSTGGLPRAVATSAGPVWVGPDNRPWIDGTRAQA